MQWAVIGIIVAVYIIYGIVILINKAIESINAFLTAPERKREAEKKAVEDIARKEQQRQRLEREQEERRKQKEELEKQRKIFLDSYKGIPVEEILIQGQLSEGQKRLLLTELFGYTLFDVDKLIKDAAKAEERARLKAVKRNLEKRLQEKYNDVPSDDKRVPISDDVKMFVWKRDGGKCVKCRSEEKLEFDHIIPVSKGGSNTERNIQLLCEKCNREKSDNI